LITKETNKNAVEKFLGKRVLIAKKDFVIRHNEYFFEIKEGQDISHIPEQFIQNLKTEKVI